MRIIVEPKNEGDADVARRLEDWINFMIPKEHLKRIWEDGWGETIYGPS